MPYYILDDTLYFPPVALADKEGILAIGGDLSLERLLLAYQLGIFPWYSPENPILWWSPNPRFVLYPHQLKIAKSMRPILRSQKFTISIDQHFREVIRHCQVSKRPGQSGTWITEEMLEAYCQLHALGLAHSVEVYMEEKLVGGLYGVSLGRCFFGESMFSKVSNASKAGFITLVQILTKLKFQIIDCQVYTKHLASLGAVSIARDQYLAELKSALVYETLSGSWKHFIES